jgi:hypothetical protein
VTSSIEIGAGSRVEGGILVMCTKGAWDWLLRRPCPPPLVVIGPDAIVQGTLTLEQKVRLYVSDHWSGRRRKSNNLFRRAPARWLACRSMLDTKGVAWAFAMHVVQDTGIRGWL